MSDETRAGAGTAGEERGAPDGEEGAARGNAGGRRFSDGIRNVNAVLSAFKEAVEESFNEARDRGDLSTERARELVQGALSRAREAAGEAKERLDFVSHRDFEDLTARVEELRVKLDDLEARLKGDRRSEDGSGGPSSDPTSGPV